jgi:hypothetical protein
VRDRADLRKPTRADMLSREVRQTEHIQEREQAEQGSVSCSHPTGGGGWRYQNSSQLNMATCGTSRLFTGIRLDDDQDNSEEVVPRRPILASDGTSGSSHVFSMPKSQATTQVEEDKDSRGLSKVGLFYVCNVDDICGGVVGKVNGESGGAACFCTCLHGDCRYVTHRENKALIEDQTYCINTP